MIVYFSLLCFAGMASLGKLRWMTMEPEQASHLAWWGNLTSMGLCMWVSDLDQSLICQAFSSFPSLALYLLSHDCILHRVNQIPGNQEAVQIEHSSMFWTSDSQLRWQEGTHSHRFCAWEWSIGKNHTFFFFCLRNRNLLNIAIWILSEERGSGCVCPLSE